MDYNDALDWAGKKLAAKSIRQPQFEAQLILSCLLEKPKEFINAHSDQELSLRQLSAFRRLVARRAKHEPLAYLVGKKNFYGLDFFVDNRVLIPRPETELLIEAVLSYASKLNNKKITIADIGTGSGCIAITLKRYLPQSRIIATDVSAKALAVARKNARLNRVDIKFLNSDLLKRVKKIKIDIIAANLPYLKKSASSGAAAEVKSLRFEPKGSLFSGSGGLDHYRRLFEQISEFSFTPRYIICEIGHDQGKPILKLAKKFFPGSVSQLKKDYSGFDRILVIEYKQ